MSEQRMCVISLGINGPPPSGHPEILFQDFPRGIRRIKEKLNHYHFRGDFIGWDKVYPEGSPTHQQAPYAFKAFCFYEAHKLGYQLVLWLDTSMLIQQPIEPLFELIEKEGYLIFQEDHSVGQFCKDDALEPLGITREESFTLPSCMSGVIGLNLASQRSREFLRQWKEKARDGITFTGPKWNGTMGWPRTASLDPRVHGHRSQTVASVIALKLGMDRWKSKQFLEEFFEIDRIFVRNLKEKPSCTTIRTHYNILREYGLRHYFLSAYDYRKNQIGAWIRKMLSVR